jgi:hypothetical protein
MRQVMVWLWLLWNVCRGGGGSIACGEALCPRQSHRCCKPVRSVVVNVDDTRLLKSLAWTTGLCFGYFLNSLCLSVRNQLVYQSCRRWGHLFVLR